MICINVAEYVLSYVENSENADIYFDRLSVNINFALHLICLEFSQKKSVARYCVIEIHDMNIYKIMILCRLSSVRFTDFDVSQSSKMGNERRGYKNCIETKIHW